MGSAIDLSATSSYLFASQQSQIAQLSSIMSSSEMETASDSNVNEKIATLKSSAKKVMERKVLPKRTTRGVRKSKTSESSAGETSADESFISGTSSQEEIQEPTEAHYLWGCELTRKNSSYVLPFPSEDDAEAENQEHLLTLKSATLGIDAEEGDRDVVEICYHDIDDKETRAVLASLTLGKADFCRLDLRVSHLPGHDVTLKLIKGSGPVSILGNHLVEAYDGPIVHDADFQPDASSAESTDASGMETEGDEVEANEIQDITEDAKKAEAEKKK